MRTRERKTFSLHGHGDNEWPDERGHPVQATRHALGHAEFEPFLHEARDVPAHGNVPHTVEPARMTEAPKGKVPYVRMGGVLMGDSQLIIDALEREAPPGLDGWLSDRERAEAHAVRRMLDEGTYFAGMYQRWATDDGFALLAPEFKKLLPAALGFAVHLIRGKVKKTLRAQGTGRHTTAEVERIAMADYAALATILGDKPFLFGEKPCVADASAFSFVEGVSRFPRPSSLRDHVLQLGSLLAYRDRIRARWWPEL